MVAFVLVRDLNMLILLLVLFSFSFCLIRQNNDDVAIRCFYLILPCIMAIASSKCMFLCLCFALYFLITSLIVFLDYLAQF